MKKKTQFSDLTNDELLLKLRENLDHNDMIFEEICDRKNNGEMDEDREIRSSLREYFQDKIIKNKKLA